MTIIFAPTKLFNKNAQTTNQKTMFNDMTNQIVLEIQKLSKIEIQSKYKLSDKLIDDVIGYYKNFNTNERYVAFDYYLGESFKFLSYNKLNKSALKYLNNNVYIIDALYGIIRPLDGIKPYRMDFTWKAMKSKWKVIINDYFKVNNHKIILSLASKEFSALIDKKIFDIYEVSFMDCQENVCKKVSVFNKQMRGVLLKEVVEKGIESIEDLPTKIHGYHKNVEGRVINYIRYSN